MPKYLTVSVASFIALVSVVPATSILARPTSTQTRTHAGKKNYYVVKKYTISSTFPHTLYTKYNVTAWVGKDHHLQIVNSGDRPCSVVGPDGSGSVDAKQGQDFSIASHAAGHSPSAVEVTFKVWDYAQENRDRERAAQAAADKRRYDSLKGKRYAETRRAKPNYSRHWTAVAAVPKQTAPAHELTTDVAEAKRDPTLDGNLIYSAGQGDMSKFLHLYQQGGNLNARQKDGTTALMTAAAYDQLPIAKFIIAKGGDVAATNEIGDTALIMACRNGHADIAAYLISMRANVNAANLGGRTALMEAVDKQDRSMIDLLLTSKADVNASDSWGNTALMLAAKNGSNGIVSALLNAHADVTKRNAAGMTAASYASQTHHAVAEERIRMAGGMD